MIRDKRRGSSSELTNVRSHLNSDLGGAKRCDLWVPALHLLATEVLFFIFCKKPDLNTAWSILDTKFHNPEIIYLADGNVYDVPIFYAFFSARI